MLVALVMDMLAKPQSMDLTVETLSPLAPATTNVCCGCTWNLVDCFPLPLNKNQETLDAQMPVLPLLSNWHPSCFHLPLVMSCGLDLLQGRSTPTNPRMGRWTAQQHQLNSMFILCMLPGYRGPIAGHQLPRHHVRSCGFLAGDELGNGVAALQPGATNGSPSRALVTWLALGDHGLTTANHLQTKTVYYWDTRRAAPVWHRKSYE